MNEPVDYGEEAVVTHTKALAPVWEPLGLTPRFANAAYGVCSGGEADTPVETAYSFGVDARLDFVLGQTGSSQRAQSVVGSLAGEGWTPRDDDWAPGGVHAAGSGRWTVYASRDEVSLRVDLYVDQPLVLMSARGPCRTAADGQGDKLVKRSPRPIVLAGEVALTDSPLLQPDGSYLPPRQP